MVPRTRRYGLLEQYLSLKRNNVLKNLSCVAQPFLGYPPDKVRQENLFLFDIKNKKFKTSKRKLFSQANSVKDYVGVFT